jgi:hypothetical protein
MLPRVVKLGQLLQLQQVSMPLFGTLTVGWQWCCVC